MVRRAPISGDGHDHAQQKIHGSIPAVLQMQVRLPGPAPAGPAARNCDRRVMGMLAGHLPLSLIMDLAMPAGPHSRELLDAEAASGDDQARE